MQSTIRLFTNSDFYRGFRWLDPLLVDQGYLASEVLFTVKVKTADGPGATLVAHTLTDNDITQDLDGWIRIFVFKAEIAPYDPGPVVWDCVMTRASDGVIKTLQAGEGVIVEGVSP